MRLVFVNFRLICDDNPNHKAHKELVNDLDPSSRNSRLRARFGVSREGAKKRRWLDAFQCSELNRRYHRGQAQALQVLLSQDSAIAFPVHEDQIL